MKFNNLTQLYQYLDDLVANDASSDELFASSYLRGFISLSASQFGDESQALTTALANDITEKVQAARTELSPDDRIIVKQYWAELSQAFTA
ncbi:YfcL family protein [Thalassotalea profundi]|uniref:YfcL family protein n=1 Tax=Thalassotalea profundi TaxID=2036687 RepID=UPI001672DCBC|nr:YfcL family protein [Thalassotalea profundi]